MIKVLFFARLREELNCESVELEIENKNIADVKQFLIKQRPEWQAVFTNRKLLTAINQTMVSDQALVKSGDEVAFFPPVTGG